MDRREFLGGAGAFAILPHHLPRLGKRSGRYLLYVGSRGTGEGKGLYVCEFDPAVGAVTAAKLAADIALPTAFALSGEGEYLYTNSEIGNYDGSDGKLHAFRINYPDGSLTLLNSIPSDGGGPTNLCLDSTGRHLLVAYFGAGKTSVFELGGDGSIGKRISTLAHAGKGPTPRQNVPRAHQVVLSPGERFLLSPDLGADRLYVSHYDRATGAITAGDPGFVQMPAGTGPRHVVFHPTGKFVYLMSELNATITVFAWDGTSGELMQIQTVLPSTLTAAGGDITIAPGGRLMYTCTRADNAIEVFAVDHGKGTLTRKQSFATGGEFPWGFAMTPDGTSLAATNNKSNQVATFTVDRGSGALTPLGVKVAVNAPVSAIFVPA